MKRLSYDRLVCVLFFVLNVFGRIICVSIIRQKTAIA